jgi:hypothetical protein
MLIFDKFNNQMLLPQVMKDQEHFVIEYCNQKSIIDKEQD